MLDGIADRVFDMVLYGLLVRGEDVCDQPPVMRQRFHRIQLFFEACSETHVVMRETSNSILVLFTTNIPLPRELDPA